AAAIAAAVHGTLVGDGSVVVNRAGALDRAGPRDVSFFGTSKYSDVFAQSTAGVVLVAPELAELPGRCAARVIVPKPGDALAAILQMLYVAPSRVPGVHPTAVVAPTAHVPADARIEPYAVIEDGARLGARAWIGPHCVVGAGATLGDDVRLFAQVTIHDGVTVGDRVIVHSGARIGGDGFGFVFRDGAHQKVPQVGTVVIGHDVEIGANVTIDRGSIDDTVVGDGTKIDNLTQIGHNVRIGRLCIIMSQVGIAGSVRVEDGVILAGQVGVAGHVTIGAMARVAAQGGVISDIPAGETWGGYPARPHRESLRSSAAVMKLPALLKRIERLLSKEGV
ncbi:MAG: UDP-3-O-(3-hydroxymyristoyl)glucosamine N-acyltransferase, partial [Gemmatimonadetes bacterium]|nr:UDP-3-O-(3-hydroxymyristoyl)glucosamine N-acyltransferase [Gemmatimonadota bacterium]